LIPRHKNTPDIASLIRRRLPVIHPSAQRQSREKNTRARARKGIRRLMELILFQYTGPMGYFSFLGDDSRVLMVHFSSFGGASGGVSGSIYPEDTTLPIVST